MYSRILYFFFFNDTATTEIYTLSLHDALPILFPRASAEQLLRQCSRAPTPIQGTWNPSPDQVRLLEGPLSVLLDRQLSALRLPYSLRPHAGDYYRQYAGVIVGGRRIIYVNGFHKPQVAEP